MFEKYEQERKELISKLLNNDEINIIVYEGYHYDFHYYLEPEVDKEFTIFLFVSEEVSNYKVENWIKEYFPDKKLPMYINIKVDQYE
jgi:hypothetical protein